MILFLVVHPSWSSSLPANPSDSIYGANFEGAKLAPKLHTDFLKEKYGEIGVNVLSHNENLRVVEIVSKNSESPHLLTFAVSAPNQKLAPELAEIHQLLKKGKESMGEAFQSRDYKIFKRLVFREAWPVLGKIKKQMPGKGVAQLQVYEFWVQKSGGDPQLYSMVGELDAPELWPSVTLKEALGSPQRPNNPDILEQILEEYRQRTGNLPK